MESIRTFLQENEIAQFACSIGFVILFVLLLAWFLNSMLDALAHSRAKSRIRMERAKQEEEFKRQLESEKERRTEILFNEKEKTYRLQCLVDKSEVILNTITRKSNEVLETMKRAEKACHAAARGLENGLTKADDTQALLTDAIQAAKNMADELTKQVEISQEIVNRRDLYRNFSLRELSGMPDDTIIGEDGLPRIIGSRGWGEYYTRYKSYDGKRYHRAGCAHAFTRVHVFSPECPTIPCMSCLPEPLPDREWFDLYRLHYQEAKKAGASLKPDPLECALLNADISDLSGSKGG